MNNTAIFTISSNNYFAFTKTLLQSVRDFHDDVDLYFLLADEVADNKILSEQNLFHLRTVKEIGISDYKKMAFAYDIVEFNTAVKPFFINYLFEKGYEKVVYIDPDILVCNRLDGSDELNNHSIVVTHCCHRPKT
jgi:lipopolysaccharide biosynthesis glycosyltransferase